MTDTRTTHEEWLAWRREGLGASDIAGVLGLSPWSSPWSVWWSKVGPISDSAGTEAMRFGRMAEDMLARYFEEDTGLSVDGQQTRKERPDHPWMRCTVDGFAYDGPIRHEDMAVAAVEFKTAWNEPPEAWSPEVPLHYACQATWTAIVTGHPVIMFCVLHSFGRVRHYTFRPSADDVRLVTRAATEFWTEHVLTGSPPPVDGDPATTAALAQAYEADPTLDAVEADTSLARCLDHIAANEERIRGCQRIVDEQKNMLREAMGNHTALSMGTDDKGKPRIIATWKDVHRSGYVVEESTSRVLRIMKNRRG